MLRNIAMVHVFVSVGLNSRPWEIKGKTWVHHRPVRAVELSSMVFSGVIETLKCRQSSPVVFVMLLVRRRVRIVS